MSKEKAAAYNTMWQEMFSLGVYKRTQGKITRQITCIVIWIVFALASFSLSNALLTRDVFGGRFLFPGLLLLVGLWIGYRLVNYPRFADFLIAVEAEMNKVSWPSRQELVRSSVVVIAVIVILTMVLLGFDLFWVTLFKALGIVKHGGSIGGG